MPLDEQLIARSNSRETEAENSESGSFDFGTNGNNSAVKSGEFRKSVRDGNSNGYNKNEGNYNKSEKEDFRSSRIEALRERASGDLKNKVIEKAASPVKQATSSLLKSAWTNLIPTFGLSLIWIDIHIFLSQVLGKDLFCSLGEEWLPKGMPKNLEGAKRYASAIEGAGVFGLNIGCLFIILFALSIIAMIVSGISNPLKAIKAIFGGLWCTVIGGCNKDNSAEDMIISLIDIISNA